MERVTAVLAVDQAKLSGWAAFVDGRVRVGVARTQFEIEGVVRLLDGRVSVVVFEDHSFLRMSSGVVSTKGILGMGRARGRWEASLDLARQDERLRFSVSPRDWRRSVLGLENPRREVAKAAAIAYAARTLGMHETELDENAAEALCILQWRGWQEKAAEALRPRRRRK